MIYSFNPMGSSRKELPIQPCTQVFRSDPEQIAETQADTPLNDPTTNVTYQKNTPLTNQRGNLKNKLYLSQLLNAIDLIKDSLLAFSNNISLAINHHVVRDKVLGILFQTRGIMFGGKNVDPRKLFLFRPSQSGIWGAIQAKVNEFHFVIGSDFFVKRLH